MASGSGTLVSINLSERTGTSKTPVQRAELRPNHGLSGDAHAGEWHRQVSLLALESIESMRRRGAQVDPGDFAENLTVAGLELHTLPIGARLRLGPALLEVTQIGKECHNGCAIFQQIGDCVMPREGIFVRVLVGGEIKVGDKLELVDQQGDER